jgi:hypothetical protein
VRNQAGGLEGPLGIKSLPRPAVVVPLLTAECRRGRDFVFVIQTSSVSSVAWPCYFFSSVHKLPSGPKSRFKSSGLSPNC